MVNARLHIICGNCGCNNAFELQLDYNQYTDDASVTEEPEIYLLCGNCATLHNLKDTITN